jgi:hypothetical protein
MGAALVAAVLLIGLVLRFIKPARARKLRDKKDNVSTMIVLGSGVYMASLTN